MIYNKIIYRGISSKYKNCPLNSSAMREKEITYLEDKYIKLYGEKSFENYKYLTNNLDTKKIKLFKDIDNYCPWAWFLSIINILIEVKNDANILNNIKYSGVISAFESLTTLNVDLYPENVYRMAKDVFSPDFDNEIVGKLISNSTASLTVYALEYFQHLNYDVRGDLDYNPFPTMVMDWTESIQIASAFANKNNKEKIIVSIDYEKYKELLYDEWYPIYFDEFIASTVQGFTPYFDYHFLYSKKNINIQTQKGIVLFWPWNYTIDDLENNSLGQKIGFKIISS